MKQNNKNISREQKVGKFIKAYSGINRSKSSAQVVKARKSFTGEFYGDYSFSLQDLEEIAEIYHTSCQIKDRSF